MSLRPATNAAGLPAPRGLPGEPGPPAPAALRIRAFLWDYLILLGYIAALTAVSIGLSATVLGDRWESLFASPVRADLMAFLLLVLPVMLYFTLAEASSRNATWGKRRVGLEVVDTAGRSVGAGRALLRNVLKFLPWQLAHTAMFHIPGFPMAPGDAPPWTTLLLVCAWILAGGYLLGLSPLGRGRTLYDRLSGTGVRRTPNAGPPLERPSS